MSLLSILETLLIGPLKLVFEIVFVIADRVLGGNPGLAIVFLSLLVNVLMTPLYRRADAIQEEARNKEAELRDGVAHIKKMFSGDERMMILQTYYRQNNYKPTSVLHESVSLLLEIPFFMAAYQFLSKLTVLQGTSFGPIADLGSPDGLLVIGGIVINVLPILMTLINILSGAVYSKGFPLKTKLQMYGLAGLFLVVLYNSPAGLVFYWTLNNVFSLGKNIFSRVKCARKAGILALFAAGAGIFVYSGLFYQASLKRKLFVMAIGAVLMLPWLWQRLGAKIPARKEKVQLQPNNKLFTLCCVLITILLGALIPSTYIASSVLEFVESRQFYHPALYVLRSFCMAVGMFLVWLRVFYWLANEKGKAIFDMVVLVLSGIMLVNYMFFGRELGIISPNLVYEEGLHFTKTEIVSNLAVILLLAVGLWAVAKKWPRPVMTAMLTVTLAIGGMSVMNCLGINREIGEYTARVNLRQSEENTSAFEDRKQFSKENAPQFRLSKTGQNVVIIMLDRALGEMVPYIMQEKPELKEQFAGFTYYANTISFGGSTIFGTPGLFGGYEYTPVEMNRSTSQTLKEKHNEALKVMPVLFLENGYEVTVFDPPLANLSWIPDLGIYDEYPQINTYLAETYFTEDLLLTEDRIGNRNRNFFCFGLMKTMPLVLQDTIYNDGSYNQAGERLEVQYESMSVAIGVNSAVVQSYNELCNMQTMTDITEENVNTFMMMSNHITHEPALFQTPNYELAEYVDNTQYDLENTDRFMVDGKTIRVDSVTAMQYYHVNMAALLRLGEWFDYLRANDVYDNTRIIVVADHGRMLDVMDDLIMDTGDGNKTDVSHYYPMLMVKDFGAKEFTISDAFMTNADVPTLATQDVIQSPVNPFTGTRITAEEKTAHRQYIIVSSTIDLNKIVGSGYWPAKWASVESDIWDKDNWSFYNEETVLTEHAFPQ